MSLTQILAGFLAISQATSFELRGLRRHEHHRLGPVELTQFTREHHEEFQGFIKKHGRKYTPDSSEYHHRLAIFVDHVSKAQTLNSKPNRRWRAGATPLADFTEEELKQKKGWFGGASATRGFGQAGTAFRKVASLLQASEAAGPAKAEELPVTVDKWNSLTALATVVDQGACGSCWAVTSSVLLDSHAEIYNSTQRSFSTEELLNCVPNPAHCGGDGGCQGATVELAMNYALRNVMLTSAEEPYTASSGNCPMIKASSSLVATTDSQVLLKEQTALATPGRHTAGPHRVTTFGMKSYRRLPENRYEPLLRAVYELGPVGISVAADGWEYYVDGIYDECGRDAIINHAVTLIGYGQDADGTKFWRIQNSWGPYFGENGRIRLLRQDDEESYCGLDRQPQQGSGCQGGPTEVQVCGMCGILYDTVVPIFKAA